MASPASSPRESFAGGSWRLVRPDPFDPERPYSTDYYHPDQPPPLINRHGRTAPPYGPRIGELD